MIKVLPLRARRSHIDRAGSWVTFINGNGWFEGGRGGGRLGDWGNECSVNCGIMRGEMGKDLIQHFVENIGWIELSMGLAWTFPINTPLSYISALCLVFLPKPLNSKSLLLTCSINCHPPSPLLTSSFFSHQQLVSSLNYTLALHTRRRNLTHVCVCRIKARALCCAQHSFRLFIDT